MWKWRFVQMAFLDEQTGSEYWIIGVREEFFATLYLVTNLKYRPYSLVYLCLHTQAHTHILSPQNHAVSIIRWQSIMAVETAQVLCVRKIPAKTSMRIWTLHTQNTFTQLSMFLSQQGTHCWALGCSWASFHKNANASTIDYAEQKLIQDN